MVIETDQLKEKSKMQATAKNLRVFGIGGAIILSGIWALRLFVFHHGSSWVLLAIALYLLIAGLFLHPLLKPIYKGWTWIAHKIGWFNTRLLLGLIFYLVLAPTGLMMRIFGKDPLPKRVKAKDGSYWLVYDRPFNPDNYKKEF